MNAAEFTNPQSHIGAVVHVEYGRCCGLPILMGKGRIAAEKAVRGCEYFLVEPITDDEGTIPLAKWVMRSEIKSYDWNTPQTQTTPVSAAA